jgi:hypothetical protein
MIEILQFAALLFTSLSMGVHFGTWLTEAPLRETRSGALFTEVQQGRDRVAARARRVRFYSKLGVIRPTCIRVVSRVCGAFAHAAAVFLMPSTSANHSKSWFQVGVVGVTIIPTLS